MEDVDARDAKPTNAAHLAEVAMVCGEAMRDVSGADHPQPAERGFQAALDQAGNGPS